MKTYTTSQSEEVGGAKFFTWAVILVAGGLLLATTSQFMPERPAATDATPKPATAVVQTVPPDRAS
ncbi:MAG TPA: hypothetical protein VG843_08050 [Rhizomicrobium sp.]|jgi:hypothetical protein|nr:hypothetical protein [Rhizomicrobium sp.]